SKSNSHCSPITPPAPKHVCPACDRAFTTSGHLARHSHIPLRALSSPPTLESTLLAHRGCLSTSPARSPHHSYTAQQR
ncbi:hypothetical protein BDN72DRAFT_940361, partial [Pluteus cervinus]